MFGAGGVGGFFGGKLARSGVDVCFISRGAHLAALQASGLRVASVHGDFELAPVVATSNPAEAGPVGRSGRHCRRRVERRAVRTAGQAGRGLPERHLAFADSLEAGSYSSLYHDLDRGGAAELEALLGEVTRRAARTGASVPMSEALYAVLQPWDLRSTSRGISAASA